MNSLQTYKSCCVFQVRYKLHQQNVSDGLAHCVALKSTWQRPWLKSETFLWACSDEHCITQIALSPTIDTFARKHSQCRLLLANRDLKI